MEDNGKGNAQAWMGSISEMVEALDSTIAGETGTIDGEEFEDEDDARERIQESALSVCVRSGWYVPGGDSSPEEFEILLTTGGPAARIVGDLDEYGQAESATLEHQDWGTPWTRLAISEDEREALLTFVNCFYFGE